MGFPDPSDTGVLRRSFPRRWTVSAADESLVTSPSRLRPGPPRRRITLGKRRGAAICAALLLLSATSPACATARVGHFSSFAEAGRAFSGATSAVLSEAGAVAIEADSLLLVKDRDALPQEERGTVILERNELLKERLTLLGDLQRHADLLSSYFTALAALAESDAPSSIGDVAEGLAGSLGRVSSRIKEARVGGLTVSSFVGQVAEIAVANFRLAALESELRVRAGIIEKELELQEVALTAVANQMRTDLTVQLQLREAEDVVLPYVQDGRLPRNWGRDRLQVLQGNLVIDSMSAAVTAARKLRLSFVSLVEGRLTLVDLSALFDDLNQIVTLVEGLRADSEQ